MLGLFRRLHHIDLFRGTTVPNLASLLNLSTIMSDDVCLIEWPDCLGPEELPARGVLVRIADTSDQEELRDVRISLVQTTTGLSAGGPDDPELAQDWLSRWTGVLSKL